jgi:tetratricopeptide (TPR) repeat protein
MVTSGLIGSRYEILNTIGEGGMGDVFRGKDTQTGEIIAIKCLKPDIVESAPDLIERFEREGEALRQLDHPNIVKMLAAVEENGMHYLIIEYVGGGSLEDLINKQKQLPEQRVLEIALDLADALTRAHRLKIIHRDIKPANVLLAEDGTPRLTDFGIARIDTRSRMTDTGSLIGTYSYVSPEACRSEEVDVRTDIWSFGVMLYEMLAGARPFEGETGLAILYSIINQPVPDLAAIRPDVSPALIQLIGQMLEKDKEQRIRSVRQVGAELEAIMQGLEIPDYPTASQPPGESGKSRFATPTPSVAQGTAPVLPEASRRPWWIAGIALAALLTAVIVGIVLLRGGESTGQPEQEAIVKVDPVQPGEYMVLVAQLEPLRGVSERDVTRFIADNLAQTLEQQVPFSTVRIREYPQVITSKEAAQEIAQANGATVVVWGSYDAQFIDTEIQVGVIDAFPMIKVPRETLERTANVKVRLTDERRESIAPEILNLLDILSTADGNGIEVSRSLAILNEITVENGEIVGGGAAAELSRAMLLYMTDTPASLDHADTAVKSDPGNPIPYMYRAAAYLREGMFNRALTDIDTAQQIGPENWASPLYLRAIYHSSLSEIDQALPYWKQIVDLRPNDWFAHVYLGAIYYEKADYTAAQAELEQAIELRPTASFPYILALVLALREGRFPDAQSYLNTILTDFPDPLFAARLTDAMFGSNLPNIWSGMFAAFGNLTLGQYELAVEAADAAVTLSDEWPELYMIQGLAYCNLDDYAAAETAYSRGIEIDPTFMALYALRSEARLRQRDLAGAAADSQIILKSDLGPVFTPLLEAGVSGDWTCENFFSYDYSQLDTQSDD